MKLRTTLNQSELNIIRYTISIGSALLGTVIGVQNWRLPLIQSNAKRKPIAHRPLTFPGLRHQTCFFSEALFPPYDI